MVLALVCALLGGCGEAPPASLMPSPQAPGTEPGSNGEWLTDIGQARALATRLERPVLMFFLGSDWCLWCKRLEKETFQLPGWKDHASRHYVLMKCDFPRKLVLPEAVQKQNKDLHDRYQVDNRVPAVIITDAAGKELGRTGYFPGGPEMYIEELKRTLDPNDPSKGPQK